MDSKMVRIDFGQRTDLPPFSNMLRFAYADSGSACKLAGVQIIPLPTFANQILARTFFRFRRASVCMPSRWKVLSGEFRRRPTSLVKNFANRIVSVAEDCLSPERTFHGCSLMHFRGSNSVAHPLASPAVGKFSRASSAGGQLHL